MTPTQIPGHNSMFLRTFFYTGPKFNRVLYQNYSSLALSLLETAKNYVYNQESEIFDR